MDPTEAERSFLSRVSEVLLSLPFDLKALQEAASDPDLDRSAREAAAGAIVHTLLPQEGDGPLRYIDDVFLVRAAFLAVQARGGEAFGSFHARFAEIYERLPDDVQLFEQQLGPLWNWLVSKIDQFPKLAYKSKRAAQYLGSEEELAQLYEEGLEFETNFNVTEQQVKNRLRRADQIVELLNRRHAEERKKLAL